MDYSDRVKAVKLDDRKFTDTESGEIIEYKRLVLEVDLNGESSELEFKADRKDAQLLQAADIQEA